MPGLRPLTALALAALAAPSTARAQRPPPATDLSAPGDGRVAVTVRSAGAPLNVVVERRLPRAPADAPARGVVLGAARCVTPCTLYVPPGTLRLRANGPGVRGTDEDVEIPAEGAALRVRAGRAALHNVGIGLVAAGGTAILATMFVALADQGIFSGTRRGALDLEPPAIVGAIGAGAALLAAGIPLMLAHRNGVSRVALAPDPTRAGLIAAWRF